MITAPLPAVRVAAATLALTPRRGRAGLFVALGTDDEERRVRLVAGEHVEDLGCPLWIGPVVERERDVPGAHRPPGALAGRVDMQPRSAGCHRLGGSHSRADGTAG